MLPCESTSLGAKAEGNRALLTFTRCTAQLWITAKFSRQQQKKCGPNLRIMHLENPSPPLPPRTALIRTRSLNKQSPRASCFPPNKARTSCMHAPRSWTETSERWKTRRHSASNWAAHGAIRTNPRRRRYAQRGAGQVVSNAAAPTGRTPATQVRRPPHGGRNLEFAAST